MWRTSIQVDQIDNGFTLEITVVSKEFRDIQRHIKEYQATAADLLDRIKQYVPTAVTEITQEVEARNSEQQPPA